MRLTTLRGVSPDEAIRAVQAHTLLEWETAKRRRDALKARAETDQSIEASRERCKTLVGFIKEAWHVVEPSNPYVHGWHVDAVADHLQAVTKGEITRLIINEPPGTMKSLEVSVAWPAFEWGPAGLPTMRYLTTSYSADYVKRDSRRMRDLVLSEWYQERWPVELVREGEVSFENSYKGFREGVPFARLTGGRGHRVILDDPHSTESAESEAERITTQRIFLESVPTRLVEPSTSAIIVIMQRLHVEDVTGIAIARDLGYTHLMLPMEFEKDRRCITYFGGKTWQDPRMVEGELLFPERFPREVVERDKKAMGQVAVAGQFQQRPTIREGGMFKRTWWKIIKAAPAGTRWVRSWDIAASEEQLKSSAAYTVGLLIGRQPSGRFVIADIARLRAEGAGVRKLIKDTAKHDGPLVEIDIPQDPGAAGKIVVKDLVLMLAGYVVHSSPEQKLGDKVQRAEPVASQVESGNFDLVEGDWNQAFIDEAADFPGGKFKDQVDALSRGFARLLGKTVFSTPEDFIVEDIRTVPQTWTRVAAISMDDKVVTCVWAGHERSADVLHIYDTHVAPRGNLAILADAVRQRGKWIPVLFNPRGDKRSEEDGLQIAERLADLDMPILTAEFDIDASVEIMAQRFDATRLRIASHLHHMLTEYRRFGRDDKGELAISGNLLIQGVGMIVVHGTEIAVSEARAESDARGYDPTEDAIAAGDLGATGY